MHHSKIKRNCSPLSNHTYFIFPFTFLEDWSYPLLRHDITWNRKVWSRSRDELMKREEAISSDQVAKHGQTQKLSQVADILLIQNVARQEGSWTFATFAMFPNASAGHFHDRNLATQQLWWSCNALGIWVTISMGSSYSHGSTVLFVRDPQATMDESSWHSQIYA